LDAPDPTANDSNSAVLELAHGTDIAVCARQTIFSVPIK
jgi:hypothetical protein